MTGAGQGNGVRSHWACTEPVPGSIVTDVKPHGRRTAEAIRAAGGEASAYALDVTTAAACRTGAMRRSRDRQVDLLVNNAGIIIREGIDSPHAPRTGARRWT